MGETDLINMHSEKNKKTMQYNTTLLPTDLIKIRIKVTKTGIYI